MSDLLSVYYTQANHVSQYARVFICTTTFNPYIILSVESMWEQQWNVPEKYVRK